jgi:hypothetical protein
VITLAADSVIELILNELVPNKIGLHYFNVADSKLFSTIFCPEVDHNKIMCRKDCLQVSALDITVVPCDVSDLAQLSVFLLPPPVPIFSQRKKRCYMGNKVEQYYQNYDC